MLVNYRAIGATIESIQPGDMHFCCSKIAASTITHAVCCSQLGINLSPDPEATGLDMMTNLIQGVAHGLHIFICHKVVSG